MALSHVDEIRAAAEAQERAAARRWPYPAWSDDPPAAAALVELAGVHRRREQLDREYEAAIRKAQDAGASLRQIGRVVGRSHTSLSEWLARRER